jgi:hypothetical protein
MTRRQRNSEWEGRERLTFAVLQHVLSLDGEDLHQSLSTRIASDLAMERDETRDVLHALAAAGLIDWSPGGTRAAIATAGVRYIEREAGRRRSVRIYSPDRPGSRGVSSPAREGRTEGSVDALEPHVPHPFGDGAESDDTPLVVSMEADDGSASGERVAVPRR